MSLSLHNTAGPATPLLFGLAWSCHHAFADNGFGEFLSTDIATVTWTSHSDLATAAFGTFYEPAAQQPLPKITF